MRMSFVLVAALATVGRLSAAETTVDYVDPDYGGKIRQIKKDDGHEHNLYYYRTPWNADNSRMLGVQSDLQQRNWQVVLYDGDDGIIKTLFSIDKFDWRLVWDRKNPAILYTWKGSNLYKFDVTTGRSELLRAFSPLGLKPNGPSFFKMSKGPRQGGQRPLEIHVVDLDGANDRVLFSVPRSETMYIQNLHLSWPDQVGDWFVASVFPSAQNLLSSYRPLLDEILLVKTDGTHEYLARSKTKYWTERGRGRTGDMFWAQPLASPSSDGSRVSFNSIRSGTIDLHILYVEQR